MIARFESDLKSFFYTTLSLALNLHFSFVHKQYGNVTRTAASAARCRHINQICKRIFMHTPNKNSNKLGKPHLTLCGPFQ